MTQEIRRPLILVVDDVPKYRDNLLPDLVEMIGGRVCKAKSVEDAIQQGAKHGPQSSDALDLVILDMHMPSSPRDGDILDDAGTRCLQAIRQLKLRGCPCIVFTAFATFSDCVAAVRAGADAYIPKVQQGAEGGPEALREACLRLLKPQVQKDDATPTRAWVEKNHEWLSGTFHGKWVAFVPKSNVSLQEGRMLPERDGVVLLADSTYEALREIILNTPFALKTLPTILLVK